MKAAQAISKSDRDRAITVAKDCIRQHTEIPTNVQYDVARREGEWVVTAMEPIDEKNLTAGGWEYEVRLTDPGFRLIEIVRGQ